MKKVLSVLLCCFVLFLCVYLPVNAADEKTVLYLNYGDITIDEYGVDGYDINGNAVYDSNPLGYVITQKNPNIAIDKGVTISGTSCNVELLNLNIKRTAEYNGAVVLKSEANVTFTLSGVNYLISGSQHAGLEIPPNNKAEINGDGTLYAQSSMNAGIGGGGGLSNGTLVINSGTIYATGGTDSYGAGIGGGNSGTGGTITINGGFVYAQGGYHGAGIGGGDMKVGGNITINGGVVTAIGGDEAAGIGSGCMPISKTAVTNVIINGGSVKAVAGSGASNIGNGKDAKSIFNGVKNSDGNSVSLVKISAGDFKQLFINGVETSAVEMLHPDDNQLYLYTDSTPKIITEYMNDGSVKFIKYNASGNSQIYPFTNNCERFEDKLIKDRTASIEVQDGFSINDNTKLMYNSVCVDTFAAVSRGDANIDDEFNGMDAVIAECVVGNMLSDTLTVKLSDADGNGNVNDEDIDLLVQCGLGGDF